MRLKCITCEVLARPVYLYAARSPHVVDVTLLRRGLHNEPPGLRSQLQEQIDASQAYDAVLLAYGLCGQGTAGLIARHAPLVIPKAHDCITLFLGSRQRYQQQFDDFPGTYWFTQDYLERDDGSGAALALGSGADVELQAVYDEYVQKYGQDNADYLMEVMGAWQSHYRRAVFIDPGDGSEQAAIAAPEAAANVEREAAARAARRGWSFEHMPGNLSLVKRLLFGEWEADYLVLKPGQQVAMTYDNEVIGAL